MEEEKVRIADFMKWMSKESAVLGLLLATFTTVIAIGGFVVNITSQLSSHTEQIKQISNASKEAIRDSKEVISEHRLMMYRLDQISDRLGVREPIVPQHNSWPEFRNQPDAKKIDPSPFGKKAVLEPSQPDLGFLNVPPPPQKLIATQ